jgi:RHS repeat-associated protein
MTKAGSIYYLVYDQVGSLRVVTDSLGSVIKKIDYDSFGNIISDTNSSLTIPFSFAGGLQDQDSGLVRFGFRDYSPEIGRWTAKDPIFFRGGDTDLFGYNLNDPINWIDPEGLDSTSWYGDGRTLLDGPKNGNWGGQNWSGGWNANRHGGKNGPLSPIDSGDICYMNHDNCYANSKNCKSEKKACDQALVICLRNLNNSSKNWTFPPRPGTEKDSESFRNWAIWYFK